MWISHTREIQCGDSRVFVWANIRAPIDGELLARLMIHHSVGVRVVETMHYKKIDDEFFPDE
jgi:hypothetical protein